MFLDARIHIHPYVHTNTHIYIRHQHLLFTTTIKTTRYQNTLFAYKQLFLNGKPILDSYHNYQNHHRNNLDFGHPIVIDAAVLRHLFDSQSVFRLKCLKLVNIDTDQINQNITYTFDNLCTTVYRHQSIHLIYFKNNK